MNGSARATLASLKKEMAKSRVAKSARKKYANLSLPVPTAKLRKPHGHGEIETPFED